MVRCMTRPARKLGESIPTQELRAKPWTCVPGENGRGGGKDGTFEDDEGSDRGHWEKPDPMAGINRFMEVLATMGVEDSTRHGQAMNYFYTQLRRWPGEELGARSIRFREAGVQLDEADAEIPPRTAGLWLIEKTGLTGVPTFIRRSQSRSVVVHSCPTVLATRHC